MSDHNWRLLSQREREVDAWLEEAKKAVVTPSGLEARRLEKTILIAAGAIVEAIWGARA